MVDSTSVKNSIEEFFSSNEKPVLFAGAGVSVCAGLPDWECLLKNLAEQLRGAGDALSRHQMMECIAADEFARAAEYFYLSDALTDGRKYELLTQQFEEFDVAKVSVLALPPFVAYATTNYDRILSHLYSEKFGKAAVEVNLGDPTLTSAPYREEFYVARLHGRVEVPESMILASSHYERLLQDNSYKDYLRHLFCDRAVLFVGFSFLDPAIKSVLRAIRDNVGANHNGRHLALIEDNAGDAFLNELRHHNIQVLKYSAADGHAALWEGLALANIDGVPQKGGEEDRVFHYARRYLAATVARRKAGPMRESLVNAVAEGIVLELLASENGNGVDASLLQDKMSSQLGLSADKACEVVTGSLSALAKDGIAQEKDGEYVILSSVVSLDHDRIEPLAIVVEGVLNRCAVRSVEDKEALAREFVRRSMEYIVLRRGWDLGAAYASRKAPDAFSVREVLLKLSEENPDGIVTDGLVQAIEDILIAPNDAEAAALVELGRVSFALEMIRQSPQDMLFSNQVLPSTIYLDANVLLPAIVEGHPFRPLYGSAIEKLKYALADSSTELSVCAYYGFLNEVVSHRRIAVAEYESYGDNATSHLEREVRLYGAVNMNVFLAGYARTIIGGKTMTLDDYLAEYAPYTTEKELARWLADIGVEVVTEREMRAKANAYGEILHLLEVYYASSGSIGKNATLIAHDALQIAVVHAEMERGARPIFVSADRRLVEAIEGSAYSSAGLGVLSGVGFVQMIELFVGSVSSEASMAQFFWSTRLCSTADRVRKYFVDKALAEYDAALALNMDDAISAVTGELVEAMESEGSGSADENESEDVKLSRFVERFEPRFYEMMKLEMDKLKDR